MADPRGDRSIECASVCPGTSLTADSCRPALPGCHILARGHAHRHGRSRSSAHWVMYNQYPAPEVETLNNPVVREERSIWCIACRSGMSDPPTCRRDQTTSNKNGGRSEDALGSHGGSHLEEAGDVCPDHQVAFHAVLVCCVVDVVEDVDHDLLELHVDLFRGPAAPL